VAQRLQVAGHVSTQDLTVLDSEWGTPRDYRETRLWMAVAISPLAWLAHLVGMPVLIAAVLITIAGTLALVYLRQLQEHGSRSHQRVWFLSQLALAFAAVAQVLVLVVEAVR
jgi:hypothetical protein